MRTAEARSVGSRPDRASAVRAFVGVAIIALFVGVTLAQQFPGSPIYALRSTDNVVRSIFGQRWNLFAPDPPTANLATWAIVRYRVRGIEHVTRPADLSSAVRDGSRAERWAPPRLARVVTKVNVELERHAFADAEEAIAAGHDPSKRLPASFVERVTQRRRTAVSIYGRLLSSVATELAPEGATIVDVRGLVLRTAVNTFEERDAEPTRAQIRLRNADRQPPLISRDVADDVIGRHRSRAALIFDSGWIDFEPDVEPFEVAIP